MLCSDSECGRKVTFRDGGEQPSHGMDRACFDVLLGWPPLSDEAFCSQASRFFHQRPQLANGPLLRILLKGSADKPTIVQDRAKLGFFEEWRERRSG